MVYVKGKYCGGKTEAMMREDLYEKGEKISVNLMMVGKSHQKKSNKGYIMINLDELLQELSNKRRI